MSPYQKVSEYARTGQKPDEQELRKALERARRDREFLTVEQTLKDFDAIFGTK